LGLNIKYIINTHSHRDHIADNQRIKSEFNVKIVAHKIANVNKDVEVVDNDVLNIGNVIIQIIHTPGHTPDSICLLVDKKLLTGDTLFVGECGRTDISGGSAKEMYNSLFSKLMMLPDDYTLEKRSLEDFIEFMSKP
jgi:glyoxylase-like metal-dependent hydrolase (beta-lactamase superfamily II)